VASILALTLASALKTCYKGGCSAELCSDKEGVTSPCVWTARYDCYKTAKCEVQKNEECGWTNTTELESCFANSKASTLLATFIAFIMAFITFI
jgi:hypothetical protein